MAFTVTDIRAYKALLESIGTVWPFPSSNTSVDPERAISSSSADSLGAWEAPPTWGPDTSLVSELIRKLAADQEGVVSWDTTPSGTEQDPVLLMACRGGALSLLRFNRGVDGWFSPDLPGERFPVVSVDPVAEVARRAPETRMYAIFRADLMIPRGKFGVQCGHAFLSCWAKAFMRNPSMALAYLKNDQPKVTLMAPDAAALEKIAAKAENRGVPWEFVVDHGRTVFNGPTMTALCIGPASRTDGNSLTRGLPMIQDEALMSSDERRRWHAVGGKPSEQDAAFCQELTDRGLAERVGEMANGYSFVLTPLGEASFFGERQ